jgi:hypothetical protein
VYAETVRALTQQRELFGDEYQRINVVGDIDKSLQEIVTQMSYLTELAYHLHSKGHHGPVAKVLITGRSEVQHGLLSFRTSQLDTMAFNSYMADGDDEKGDLSLVEATRIACLVFSDMVLFPLPWSSGARPRLARRLRTIWSRSRLSESDDGVKSGIAQLKIWILWFGSLAALFTASQNWFETTLRRHISSELSKTNRPMTLEAVKPVLRGFLWFEPVCDQPGRDLWERMFNVRYEFEDVQISGHSRDLSA